MDRIKFPVLAGFLGPFVSLGGIFFAILLAPSFTLENALSDLGHWFRTDIGPNPLPRALIFNAGVFVSGILMVYFLVWLMHKVPEIGTRIGLLILASSCLCLSAVGIFSENIPYYHTLVALGFFLIAPIALLVIGTNWLRFSSLRLYSIPSLLMGILPFILISLAGQEILVWPGYALPEVILGLNLFLWFWLLVFLESSGRLQDLQ
ncbi:MAG: DUF998 domain-containing protein [Promethearchaeota archaeon]